MKKLLLFALLVSIHGNLFSQHLIDSFSNELKNTSSDTSRIMIILQMAEEYSNFDNKKAFEYLNKAKELLDKINFKKGTASYYYANGLLKKSYDFPEALVSFKKSLQLFSELQDKPMSGKAILSIGHLYSSHSHYDNGMSQYLTALKLFQSLNDKNNMAYCYSGIGYIYTFQSKFELALENQKKALNFFTDKRAHLYSYSQIAFNYLEMKEYKTALIYYDSLVNETKKK